MIWGTTLRELESPHSKIHVVASIFGKEEMFEGMVGTVYRTPHDRIKDICLNPKLAGIHLTQPGAVPQQGQCPSWIITICGMS